MFDFQGLGTAEQVLCILIFSIIFLSLETNFHQGFLRTMYYYDVVAHLVFMKLISFCQKNLIDNVRQYKSKGVNNPNQEWIMLGF